VQSLVRSLSRVHIAPKIFLILVLCLHGLRCVARHFGCFFTTENVTEKKATAGMTHTWTATATLQLETVELPDRTMFDFQWPLKLPQSPPAVVTPYPGREEERCYREDSFSGASVNCPWHLLTRQDQDKIIRTLTTATTATATRPPGYSDAVENALDLLRQTVDDPQATHEIHQVRLHVSPETPPLLEVVITYGNMSGTPEELQDGIVGVGNDSALDHAYRAGNTNWVGRAWKWLTRPGVAPS
jgi:hypothetical protein